MPHPNTRARWALVTGAASGIGYAVAKRLLRDGWGVLALDIDRAALGRAARRHCNDAFETACADVREASEVRAALAGWAALPLHAVIHSAGIFLASEPTKTTALDARGLFDVHVGGAMIVSGLCWPALRKHRGSVVCIASVSGIGGDWGLAAYNAAKGAQINWVRSLALDWGRRGVRVNAVAPCTTRTPMTKATLGVPAVARAFAQAIPLGRPAKASEVAAAVAFLLGPDASFVNGVVLPVDGGLSAQSGQPNVGQLLARSNPP